MPEEKKCKKCGMPLLEGTECKCEECVCYHCCSCGEDCSCGCHQKG